MDFGALGQQIWVVAEGYIPSDSQEKSRELISHEALCILNTSDRPAKIEIWLYYTDRTPVGPYKVRVEAERTQHLRLNDLEDPEAVPRDTDYAMVIRSDIPVVVQHTRLDSRQVENALMTTMAYAVA